jgi:hypothetical protein
MTTYPDSEDQVVFSPNHLLARVLRLFDTTFTADPSDNESRKSPTVIARQVCAVDALALAMQDGAMGG